MQEGDLVKIDLLVEHSGSRKSKEAWNRIKKDFKELAQQTHNTGSPKFLSFNEFDIICMSHGISTATAQLIFSEIRQKLRAGA